MAPTPIAVMRATLPALAGRADVIDAVFAVALRAQAPGLAGLAPRSLAPTIIAALTGGGDGVAADLDALLRDSRAGSKASAALGLALMAALGEALGPGFDDAVHAAWSEAYVDLVQRLMAARWNRMDLVA